MYLLQHIEVDGALRGKGLVRSIAPLLCARAAELGLGIGGTSLAQAAEVWQRLGAKKLSGNWMFLPLSGCQALASTVRR